MSHLEAPDRLMECQLSGNTSAEDRRVGLNFTKGANKIHFGKHYTKGPYTYDVHKVFGSFTPSILSAFGN